MISVAQILRSKGSDGVVTVAPGVSVEQAIAVLSQKRIGAVVVSPDGALVAGILSERDIVRELGRRGAACLKDPVDSIMTKATITCTPEDRSDAVLGKMTEGRFRHMPVLQDERMVGLISIGDVVKARLSELHMEKEALTGMIMGN